MFALLNFRIVYFSVNPDFRYLTEFIFAGYVSVCTDHILL